jgi:hypothetical protein
MQVEYMAGAVFLLIAAAFVASGFMHRRASIAETARLKALNPNADPERLHPSLSMLADFAPSLTIFSLVLMGATISVAFFAVGGLKWFSLLDLAGVLAAIAGYGYWMVVKTKHRSVETLRSNAAA